MTDEHPVQIVHLGAACGRACLPIWHKFAHGDYVGHGGPNPKIVGAYMDLLHYRGAGGGYEGFLRDCRKVSKGGIHADAKKADREGYVIDTYPLRLHIPDVYGDDGIHRSKATRTGGKPMKPHYLKTIPEAGGAPTGPILDAPAACSWHWRQQVGIFKPEAGHMQGSQKVDRRLVGYIGLLRMGNIALYSMIIGHGDHLANGIMGAMHAWIVDRILAHKPFPGGRSVEGLDGLIYAGMFQGGYHQGRTGLYHWKRKALFQPRYLHAL